MNIINRKRLLSTIISAVVLCGNAVSMLPALPAAAEQTVIPDDAVLNDSELIDVIVTLDGTTAIDRVDDPEDLDTSAAVSASERAEKQQERIIRKLREHYPELETGYQYTTLLNAFSCQMPEALIPYAESLGGVQSVSVSRKVAAKPDTEEQLTVNDLPAYYDETGCKGEGEVIAVIDTELNLRHPMFAPLPDDVNVKLTREDVEAIANGIGFNVVPAANLGYYSSKIPYAVDYLGDPSDILNDMEIWYHGSHVAGIAAGNPFTTEEGKLVSGIAPNAQIIFMGLDDYTEEYDFVAAIEDAVKLQADVINLSWGTDTDSLEQESPLADAINAAEAAGVTVCISAGNADYGSSYYGNNSADNPDRSMMNGFIFEGEKSLAVAAANDIMTEQMHTLMHGGTVMPYLGCASSREDFAEAYLGDVLGDAEYEYEYCGLGDTEDFEGKDLTGKLALVDRGKLDFTVKANNAKAAGAAGVIVVQNQAFEKMIMVNDSDLLLAMVSQENGEILKNAEHKTISFSGELISYSFPQEVSSYTSWGVHNTLELRPDIMGIGTEVESASYAGDETEIMSGTSMSSPYVAGCAALLDEYLDQNGCTLTGPERQQRIRNLLMTAAYPFSQDGMYVTPRRQGAGMVSMSRTAHDKVLLTGPEGESKVSLRDSLGTQFSFPVTVTNISDEDVTFASARIALTTDAADYDSEREEYVIGGQQPLNCTADLGDITSIAAGASKTVSVTVTLDAAQAASLEQIFTNGYFIEGYLLLEGAENCCDISIPMLGYSACFTAAPILGAHCSTVVRGDLTSMISAPSYFEMIRYAQTLEWPEIEEKDISGMTDEEYAEYRAGVDKCLDKWAEAEEKLKQINDTVYVSPDYDDLADDPGFLLDLKRDCLMIGCELFDADGNLVAAPHDSYPIYRDLASAAYKAVYPKESLADLPEGTYTVRASLGMTREALRNHPEILETKVVIDRTAPEICSEVKEENGRKILKLTASDDQLESVVILGNGTGSTVGNLRYEKLEGVGMKPYYDFTQRAKIPSHLVAFENYVNLSDEQRELRRNENDTEAQNPKSMLADALGAHSSTELSKWEGNYNFSEVIHAVPDEDGIFTLEYDITDFAMYHIAVIDKAFNMDYVEYADEVHVPTFIQPGIYKSLHGLYDFTEDNLTFIPFGFGAKPVSYHYEVERQFVNDITLTLYQYTGENEYAGYDCFGLEKTAGTDIYLHGASESFWKSFGIMNNHDEHLELTDLTATDGYLAIGAYEMENDYIIPFMREYTGRGAAKLYDYEFAPDAVITYTLLCNNIGGGNIVFADITVDLKTGIATTEDGNSFNLLEYVRPERGDVNCSGNVDVADAVLLSRVLAEDSSAVITADGRRNADCNCSGQPDNGDVVLILRAIARLITL